MVPRNLPLRIKLTAWYLLVYAAVQLVLLLAVALWRRDAVERANDEEVLRVAQSIAKGIAEDGFPAPEVGLADLASDSIVPTFAVVRVRGGNIAWLRGTSAREELRQFPLDNQPAAATGLYSPKFDEVTEQRARAIGVGSSALRLVTVPFRDEGSGDLLFLQLGVPAFIPKRALGDFSDLLVIGLPAGLLAAGIAVWFIAGRAVRPIIDVTLAVREVSPRNPGARVRVGGAEEELARLDRELNQALDRMEAGFRAQEQFISNVSHELETPISVMLAELQVLRRQAESLEAWRGFGQSAEEELRRLEGLVQTFLKLARFHSGLEGFLLRDVPVQDVVLEAVQHGAPFARLHQVRIVPQISTDPDEAGEAEVSGDPQLLRTMLDNLIRNAVRFSRAGDAVDVVCRAGRDEVEFVVRDRGPGVPEGWLERVFERFEQVPDSERARGTGLGLALVRDITELHGGRVSARNHEDGGSSFTVTLPRARSRAASRQLAPPPG